MLLLLMVVGFFLITNIFLFYFTGMSIEDLREYEARMQAETNKKLGVSGAATPQWVASTPAIGLAQWNSDSENTGGMTGELWTLYLLPVSYNRIFQEFYCNNCIYSRVCVHTVYVSKHFHKNNFKNRTELVPNYLLIGNLYSISNVRMNFVNISVFIF